MNDKKALSVCITASGSPEALLQCVKDCRKFADEILIAGTVDSEETQKEAQRLGAVFLPYQWEGSYSKIRNQFMESAVGRWILFLNSEETLPSPFPVRELLENPNAEAYLVGTDFENFPTAAPVQSLRLLRNREEYRFENRSFERIPDEKICGILDSHLRTFRKNSPTLLAERERRSLLLQEDLKDLPQDSFLQYMEGLKLLNQEHFEESVVYLRKAVSRLNLEALYAPHLYQCLARSFLRLGRLEDARIVLDEGMDNFPWYTDLPALRAKLFRKLGQYDEALQDLNDSLKMAGNPQIAVPEPETKVPELLKALAELYEQTYNYKSALAYWRRFLQACPEQRAEAMDRFCGLAVKTSSVKELKALLKTALKKKDAACMTRLAEALFKHRQYALLLANEAALAPVLELPGSEATGIFTACRILQGAEPETGDINRKDDRILIAVVKSCWFCEKWQEALHAIEEMRSSPGCRLTAGIFLRLHGLLTGEALWNDTDLSEEESEIIKELHDDFLWKGQKAKAEILLLLLLKNRPADFFADLAHQWAADLPVLQRILQSLTDAGEKETLKCAAAWRLIHEGRNKIAHQVLLLGNSQPTQELERILWARHFMKELREWVRKSDGFYPAAHLESENLQKAGCSLLGFYRSLLFPTGSRVQTITRANRKSASQIHREIGEFYEKNNQPGEAICAYLKSLQWEPKNSRSLAAALRLLEKKPGLLTRYADAEWFPEGHWFFRREDFFRFIRGMAHLQNLEYAEACDCFCDEDENAPCHEIFLACKTGILWMEGKGGGIHLERKCFTRPFSEFLIFLCGLYAAHCLKECSHTILFQELTEREIKRITNSVKFAAE